MLRPVIKLSNLMNPTRPVLRRGISNTATIRLYRILLRELQLLPLHSFLLQPPIDPRDYGRARLFDQTSLKDENNDIETKNILKVFSRWLMNNNNADDDKILQWYQEISSQKIYEGEEHDDFDMCSWTSRDILLSTFRSSFRISSGLSSMEKHRFAITAIHSLRNSAMILERSSVSTKDGLRVVATSSCIGKASSGSASFQEAKNRFAYRIRVENLPDNDKTVQLLGRSWVINENAEEGVDRTPPVVVNAPTTGAVGHLPVLKPGQVFEYISGCELNTKTGSMRGHFHMAEVPPKTPSAMVGDRINAIQESDKFEIDVNPFPLLAA